MQFATRPCAQRFYRHTIAAARLGDALCVALCTQLSWNIQANIGGGNRVGAAMRATRTSSSVQRFGIEIEFTGDPQAVARAAAALNLSVQVQGYNHDTPNGFWKIVQDGSCGWELVSPPLSGAEGLEQIRKACQSLHDGGAQVNARCGLHVHLEARRLTVAGARRLVLLYTANQSHLNSLVSRSRRANRFCQAWTSTEIEALSSCENLRHITHRLPNRYKTVNLTSFPKYGTVEFRQHQGTHNAEKIIKWLSLCIGLLNATTTARFTGLSELLQALNLNPTDQQWFNERAMELA